MDLVNKKGKKFFLQVIVLTILIIFASSGASKAFMLYRVEDGDSMYKIAQQYEISLDKLMKWNEIREADFIYPGQAILVPIFREEFYTVERGDTLYSIARNHYTSVEKLISINEEIDYNEEKKVIIYEGQKIKLPHDKNSPIETDYSSIKPGKIPYSHIEAQYPNKFFIKGDVENKKVALTFDDGPDSKYTPKIIDILNDHNVPGTFYYLGEQIKSSPDVLKRTLDEGHEVGNHSWSHANLRYLSEPLFIEELNKTHEIIAEYTDVEPETFRPPYGDIRKEQIALLSEKMGYKTVNWSIDTWDWWNKDKDKILINLLRGLHPGAIVLMHSAGGEACRQATVDVLPEMIYNLKLRGYEFVTVSDII